jgi:hypothetical protein
MDLTEEQLLSCGIDRIIEKPIKKKDLQTLLPSIITEKEKNSYNNYSEIFK